MPSLGRAIPGQFPVSTRLTAGRGGTGGPKKALAGGGDPDPDGFLGYSIADNSVVRGVDGLLDVELKAGCVIGPLTAVRGGGEPRPGASNADADHCAQGAFEPRGDVLLPPKKPSGSGNPPAPANQPRSPAGEEYCGAVTSRPVC